MSQLEKIYGVHAVEALLRHHPKRVKHIWLAEGRNDPRVQTLVALAGENRVTIGQAERREMDAWVEGVHQGVVADVSPSQVWGEAMLDELLDRSEGSPLLLVLDGVTDPHNLGACLRTADAAGALAVIVPKDKSATLTPAVRKVACGAAEVIPLVAVTNLARALEKLQQRGLWVVGTAGEAEVELYQQDLTGPTIIIIMGAEGKGMRRLTREHCDYLVRLPMAGSVSSLNVSVATGVCLFEAQRQGCRQKGLISAPGQSEQVAPCDLLINSPIALRLPRPFSTIAPLAVTAGAHVPVPEQDQQCHSLLV